MSTTTSVLANRPDQGKTTFFHYDEATGMAHVETVTDVSGMMERNTAKFNAWSDGSSYGDLVHIGSIPLAKYFALQKAGIICDDDPFQKRFLKWLRENYAEYQRWFCVPKRMI